ncbi:host specificity factor TipJ family phage tail protein [Xanthobacter sediminis]
MHDAIYLTLPGAITRRATPLAGETVAAFLVRTAWPTTVLPTVCALNGEPVLRAEWGERVLGEDDQLAFIARPMGGGGRAQNKQVMGLVAMIGLSLLAPGVGTFLGGGLIGAIGQGAFLVGGAFAVSTLVNVRASGAGGGDTGGVYSFGQQRNSAQLLQTIPVSYGRVKKTPPYAAVPWAEYSGNDQYLNVLLCQGSGQYSTESIYVDDTLLWTAADGVSDDFDGVDLQICPPGTPVTLFPVNVATSAEVSGQELTDDWAGGFVAAPAATTTRALAIDVAAAAGIGYTGEDGNISTYFVAIYIEARPVDDLGLPTGDWTEILHTVVSGASKKAKRWSFKINVSPGRYQVRVKRGTNALDDDSATMDTITWMGLRAFLVGTDTFASEQVIAIRMKATQQLTDSSASNISIIDTRILPLFNGTEWTEAPTRSPAWAKYDIATNTSYGAYRAPSKVDIQKVYELDALATARGDCFDYEFSGAVSVPEALDTALAACRAKHRWAGDVLTLVRDEWHEVPSMLITDREVVRGTFAADYEMLPSDSVDAIIVEYVDETTWRAEDVQYPPDYAATNPKRVELKGVVQREQAFREAGFYYRQHEYRRVSPSFDMEHDGRLISLGDQALIQSDMPSTWGAAGAVVGRDGLALTLEPAPEWAPSGQHYVMLRTKTGDAFGPVKCTRGGADTICSLDGADLAQVETDQGRTLSAVLARRDGAELPTYAHGIGTSWQRRCIAMMGNPSGQKVSLGFVVDDERVHDDDGTPDILPSLPALGSSAPIIGGLIARISQNVMEPVLTASWWAAAGAIYYRSRISYDEGASWTPLPDVTTPELSSIVEPAALWLQVQGVGAKRGAWTQVELDAPVISSENIVITIDNFEQGLRDLIEGIDAEAIAQLQEDVDTVTAALPDLNAAVTAAQEAADQAQADLSTAVTTLTDSQATAVGALQEAIGENAAAITDTQTAVSDLDSAVTSELDGMQSQVEGATALIVSVATTAVGPLREELARMGLLLAEAAAGGAVDLDVAKKAISIRLEAMQVTLGEASATIALLQETVVTLDAALAQAVTTLTASIGEASSSISAMQTALTTLQTSTASQITSLQTSVGDISSSLTTAQTAISDLVTGKASVSDLNALAATVNNPSTGLNSKASSTALTNLAATVDGKADGSALSTLAATVNNPTTGLNSKASTTDLATVSAALDGKASASSVEAIAAQVDDVESSVNVSAVATAAPAGATSAWMLQVKVTSGGAVATGGLMVGVFGSGSTRESRLYLQADKTYVMNGSATSTVWTIDGSNTYLNGNLIASGSITAAKIAAGAITGIKISADTIEASHIVLGGVTTDRIADSAVTQTRTQYFSGSVGGTGVLQALNLSITRTAGTRCSIRFSLRAQVTETSAPASEGFRSLTLYRVVNDVETEIFSDNILVGAQFGYQIASTWTYYLGGQVYINEFVDTENVSGTVYYRLKVDGRGTGFGWERRGMVLTEYKR